MNADKEKFVSIGKASILTGICQQTLRKLADTQNISCYKTPSGHRRYNVDSIKKMCTTMVSSTGNCITQQSEIPTVTKRNFIYTRVSSKKQLDDLSRQVSFIQSTGSYESFHVLRDVGSGINFKRKGIETILDSCLQKTIGTVVVAHRDRLARFGFELIKSIIVKAGGTLHVINDENTKTNEQELSEDLLSIIHIFSCRQMGKRKYKIKTDINDNINQNQIVSNIKTEKST
jgi:predicted site-specific integrase-resolvase